jgi:hypothetical protein
LDCVDDVVDFFLEFLSWKRFELASDRVLNIELLDVDASSVGCIAPGVGIFFVEGGGVDFSVEDNEVTLILVLDLDFEVGKRLVFVDLLQEAVNDKVG